MLPYVDVATGSLGQGLPISVGVAIAGKLLDRLPYRTWVLCGDSEMAEGSIWEALAQASFDKLDNLTAIIDVNRLGQTGETRYGWDLDVYADRLRAFGWHAIEIDGHDVAAVDAAYQEALDTKGMPSAIVARTIKGAGIEWVANKNGAHGKPVEPAEEAIRILGGRTEIRVTPAAPEVSGPPHRFDTVGSLELPRYELGDEGRHAQGVWRCAQARSATREVTSSPSTARSATRPIPRLSRRPIPSASSRCTSPSSR